MCDNNRSGGNIVFEILAVQPLPRSNNFHFLEQRVRQIGVYGPELNDRGGIRVILCCDVEAT